MCLGEIRGDLQVVGSEGQWKDWPAIEKEVDADMSKKKRKKKRFIQKKRGSCGLFGGDSQ